MENLFADFNFWNLIVAVLALGVGIFSIWLLLKDRKGLGYQVNYSASLVSVRDDVKSDIKIFYKDESEPLKNARIMELLFKNIGRQPIKRDEFDKPLALVFGEDARIISVEVEDESPAGLGVEFKIEGGNKVALEPLLLNSRERFLYGNGDQFSLKILGENVSDFSVEGRIEGVSKIELLHGDRIPIWIWVVGLVVIFIGLALWGSEGNPTPVAVVVALAVGFGLEFIVAGDLFQKSK